MFRKRPIIHAVTSALLLICYIVLAGASAVHEVSHIGDEHPGTAAAVSHLPETADAPHAHHPDHNVSLSCFLCLIGYQYSTFESFSFSADLITAELKEKIADVPETFLPRYVLPSLRAPPSAC